MWSNPDECVQPEDMEAMWSNPDVSKEWIDAGETKGQKVLSQDPDGQPYLTQTEMKGVLCALAELTSMRFVNGISSRVGLMGIDFPIASWLYNDVGYKAYQVNSVEHLLKPFSSMYFGAAYLVWLSNYEGRERTLEFIVQAYMAGPQNVNTQETGTLWLKFQNAYALYRDPKREGGSCSIL